MPLTRPAALFVVLAVVAAAPCALADEQAACVDAYVKAQESRQAGRLLEARKQLATCERAECPAHIVHDCARWSDELDDLVPTIVLEVRDASGALATHVRVTIDGKVLTDTLDGRAIEVDPGAHTFGIQLTGEPPKEVHETVLEGARAQRIAVTFQRPSAAQPDGAPPAGVGSAPGGREPVKSNAVPPAAIALFVVAGLGATGFAYFGLRGLSKENDLRGSCAPTCDPSQRDDVHALYVAADVSLAVGLLALGAAAWVWLSHDRATLPVTAAGPFGIGGRF